MFALATQEYFSDLITYVTSGPCRVLILTRGETGEGVLELWRDIIGPFDAAVAKAMFPERFFYVDDFRILFKKNDILSEGTIALNSTSFMFPYVCM